jgi:hypothetical protein
MIKINIKNIKKITDAIGSQEHQGWRTSLRQVKVAHNLATSRALKLKSSEVVSDITPGTNKD